VPEELFTCPPDLTLVGDGDLSTLQTSALTEFNRVHSLDNLTPDNLRYAGEVADHLERIRAELKVRDVRASETARLAQDTAAQDMARLNDRVNGPVAQAASAPVLDGDAIAAAAARGAVQGLMDVFQKRGTGGEPGRQLATLGATAKAAPAGGQPQAVPAVIVAAVDIPDRQVHANGNIPDMEALADAFITRAKSLPATAVGRSAARHMVASVRNTFTHVIDDRTPIADVERLFRDMTSPDKAEALLAGGGWCAPSEIRYELFNIADAPSGMIDLPTVGVSRGGIRFPVSPTIADVFFSAGSSQTASGLGGFAFPFANTSDPWLWSETDDILTVTGSVNKPNLRIPCASFSEVRLEAYGLSLIAGNLTDSAYPENTQNFLRLLRAAYAHAINARLIGLMATASTVTQAIGAATWSAFNTILDGVDMAAVDYRNKFAMSDDAILEVVLPRWIISAIRADLAWRTAVELQDVTDQQIMGYFTTRRVRPQFVSDWQVRGTGQFGRPAAQMAVWPTSVQFMLYAAGTFVHGTGLQLDLGVIRDSVLNAENDFTAAWAEEAHLIAKVGHESRLYTATFSVNGAGVLGNTNTGTFL